MKAVTVDWDKYDCAKLRTEVERYNQIAETESDLAERRIKGENIRSKMGASGLAKGLNRDFRELAEVIERQGLTAKQIEAARASRKYLISAGVEVREDDVALYVQTLEASIRDQKRVLLSDVAYPNSR